MKLLLVIACSLVLSSAASAGTTSRKIASVIGKDQKSVEKTAVELAKAYSTPKRGTTFKAVGFAKEGEKIVVKVESNYFDKKEQVGAMCGFTVTFEAGDQEDGQRGNGVATVESGLCYS